MGGLVEGPCGGLFLCGGSVNRIAVFVDAGYLFAQGSVELHGEKLTRGELRLNHEAVVAKLQAFAEQVSGLPLLRIYWYDGTSQGPTSQHITLAGQTNVKIRLGFVNSVGQQKGVDSLIVTDIITLARNRAMAECVLLSGGRGLNSPWQKPRCIRTAMHPAWTALLLGRICPICFLVAPCHAGASPFSVRRGVSPRTVKGRGPAGAGVRNPGPLAGHQTRAREPVGLSPTGGRCDVSVGSMRHRHIPHVQSPREAGCAFGRSIDSDSGDALGRNRSTRECSTTDSRHGARDGYRGTRRDHPCDEYATTGDRRTTSGNLAA